MALKNTIEKIEDVAEGYRALYADIDGVLTLDKEVQGEDTTALTTAKQHEKEAKEKALKKAAKLAEEKTAWEIEKAELQGDKEKADRLKQEAIDRVKAASDKEYQDKITSRDQRIHDLTVGKLRDDVANEVYIKPGVMNLQFMDDRIRLNDKDEAYIIGADEATMTRESFIKELIADESMAMFIKPGDGSGGGGKQNNGGNNNSGRTELQKKRDALMAKDPTLE